MAQEQLNSLENEFLPFLPLVKESGKKAVSCENNLFVQNRSTNVQKMETWQKIKPLVDSPSSSSLNKKTMKFYKKN